MDIRCVIPKGEGDEELILTRGPVSCAYQCLRMLNYVSQPTVDVIQILLIISNVLSYNMNAGASYTLLGTFHRVPTS